MPIAIRQLDPPKVIESIYSGVISPEETERSIRTAAQLAREQGILLFLSDLSALTVGLPISALFGLPDLFDRLGMPRTAREALVVPAISASAGDVQFYENVCNNRGWNVRLFPDRARALAWLSEPP